MPNQGLPTGKSPHTSRRLLILCTGVQIQFHRQCRVVPGPSDSCGELARGLWCLAQHASSPGWLEMTVTGNSCTPGHRKLIQAGDRDDGLEWAALPGPPPQLNCSVRKRRKSTRNAQCISAPVPSLDSYSWGFQDFCSSLLLRSLLGVHLTKCLCVLWSPSAWPCCTFHTTDPMTTACHAAGEHLQEQWFSPGDGTLLP